MPSTAACRTPAQGRQGGSTFSGFAAYDRDFIRFTAKSDGTSAKRLHICKATAPETMHACSITHYIHPEALQDSTVAT